ncbi:MAG: BPTI/Kunitz-type proteinase inhibitor domain-containing protein [Cyclobacteriaceae bacterium]
MILFGINFYLASGNIPNKNESWILVKLLEKDSKVEVNIPRGEYIELSFHDENCISINTRCTSNSGIFNRQIETFEYNEIRAMISSKSCTQDYFSKQLERLLKNVVVLRREYNLLEVVVDDYILMFSLTQLSIDLYCIDPCNLVPESGTCRALTHKFYYDQDEGRCKSFVYGGCGGTVPFESLEDCQKKCGR